ncbi:chemotaxis protein CheB [Sulfuriflexus sp.]|uniref:chemotaxis protein CheB n=1 Tax=Sulfuriflexus sp. TaxID=2015443 RepID=UPI0028CD94D7|nr:chemotaxis protein CheB [Sulfuriflexus sp.]MDT8403125.1 chemotaxis protein CheB [Sulfuriflexus sp.]
MSHAEMTAVAETSQLRVALLSDSDNQRANLKTLLEGSGMQVIESRLLCAESIRRLNADDADVLLVDLDDNVERDLDFFDELLESPLPTLFNEANSTRMRAAQPGGDWGRNLARKLNDMVGESVEKVVEAAVQQVSVKSRKNAGALTALDSAPADPAADTTPAREPNEVPAAEITPEYLAEAEYLESIKKQALLQASLEVDAEKKTVSKLISTAGVAARNVWVIGASIGGPQMVKRFLAEIKADIPVAFVLAQHIGSNFVPLLAKQLDQVSHFKVVQASEGHLLRHNEVVVAPTTQRVTIDAEGYIRLKAMEFKSIYTPSIDTVMTDISIRYGSRTSAIVFSGMGNDGVRGAQLIASRGGKVWAQDSATCVVSSMPDSTRRAGIVSFSAEPELLSEHLTTYFETHTR